MDVLPFYGATPSNDRVVIDGNYVSAGGVTSGIDGSLILVALLRGDQVAKNFNSIWPTTRNRRLIRAHRRRHLRMS